jgi:curved DNA-binding protein CbpA
MLQEEIDRILRDSKDPYLVLGISRQAASDAAAVKKSYRALALRLHPDKNPDPRAQDAFKAVCRAQAILTDPRKRAVLEQQGTDGYTKFEAAGEQLPPSIREMAAMALVACGRHSIRPAPAQLSPFVLLVAVVVLLAVAWPLAFPSPAGGVHEVFSFYPEPSFGLTHARTFLLHRSAGLSDELVAVRYYVSSAGSSSVDEGRLQKRLLGLAKARCRGEQLLIRGSEGRRAFNASAATARSATRHWRPRFQADLSATVRSDSAVLRPSDLCKHFGEA